MYISWSCSCAGCQILTDNLLGLNQAVNQRKKRATRRRKRQATSTPTWLGGDADEIDKCVAKELGMSQKALLEYEERISIAEMGMIPCYLLSYVFSFFFIIFKNTQTGCSTTVNI